MSILITDDFNRGNGGLGANWTTITGMANPQIVSNLVQPEFVAGTGSLALYTATSLPNDQYAKVQLITANSSGAFPGLLLRGTTTERTQYEFYAVGPLGSTVDFRMVRYNAGSSTALASTGANQTVATLDTFEARVSGTILKIFLNGVEKLSFDDNAAPIASGRAGMHIYTAGGVTSDVQVDNFEAGDFLGTIITGLGRKHQGFIYAIPYL